jgi:ABC-type transport system involved in cytochrome c biogenesis permease subunit
MRYLVIFGLIIHTFGLIILSFALGHPPFTNIFETLLLLSWFIVIIWLLILRRYLHTYLDFASLVLGSIILFYSLTYYWSQKPLLPALQSPWLHIHVSSCFLAYAFFFLSAISGLIYLFKPHKEITTISLKLINFGFPLLSFGIISGAIWAYFAWGRYWGWDPKEVWALISWLFYLGILHARLIGFKEKNLAYLNILGFFILLFTYLGVNLLLKGLHSYA